MKTENNYEAPFLEVVTVRIERTILSGLQSSRASYGSKNQSVNANELDNEGNWAWD